MTLSWTDEEKEFIRAHYKKLSYRAITVAMNAQYGNARTRDAVKTQVAFMGLNSPRGCISDRARDEQVMYRWRRESS